MAEAGDEKSRDAGLWARCFAEADGDEGRAKAAYIKARVEQLKPKPTTGACPNCGREVALVADGCVHCKAIFDRASGWSPDANKPVTQPKESAVPVEKQKSKIWLWVVGVPVVLFALMMVLGSMNADPVKDRDRRTYDFCLEELAGADRARNGSATALAGVCETMRKDFQKKYGRNP